MRREDPILAPVDVGLLDLLSREPNLVAACTRLGIRRDRGVYRLRRIERLVGRPAVVSTRGGPACGTTRLTPLGRRLLARGVASPLGARAAPDRRPPANAWRGTWHGAPAPNVEVGAGLHWTVDFLAREGERVDVTLAPEAVLLARDVIATSARNVLRGRVEHVRSTGPGTGGDRRIVVVRVGRARVRAAVTDRSVKVLGLERGRPVVLYVKATALHRRDGRRPRRRPPTRGSRPS
ncbi:MAG: TOBE domain-containing protein [Thermoplasmata archaeon]